MGCRNLNNPHDTTIIKTTIKHHYRTMSTTTNNTQNSQVHLAVYDLSHGMARQMSAQFLGPQFALDLIPHTALVVFGREYFFGGGIQHEDPRQFRQMTGMHPVQTLELGHTSVSQAEFEQWCQRCMQNGRYTAASYDLLERNCNNFSHDAALEGLQLAHGVPAWILEVPRKFLSSPMGQMVRPMLQNMQVTGGSGASGGGMAAPFASAPTSTFGASAAAPAAPPVDNPWANIPSAPTAGAAAPKDSETKKPAPESKNDATKDTLILDSFCKPLLSSDSKTIPLCVKKIVGSLEEASDKEALESIGTILAAGKRLTSDQVEQACHGVAQLLQSHSSTATFALMFLRVVVLQSTGHEPAARSCLEWIATELTNNHSSSTTGILTTSHAARSMAWLTLANAASLPWWEVPETILEATLGDLSVILQPRPEVRQAAAALCYNVVVMSSSSQQQQQEEDLSDQFVSLLCSSLESIDTEPDATTRLRRVMVAARILQPVTTTTTTSTTKSTSRSLNGPAKLLMQELGFVDALQELVSDHPTTTGNARDGETCRSLANEMLGLLQN